MTRGVRVRRPAGFTLLELMIALAIVAILTGVAIPSYHRQAAQAHHASAVAALYRAAQYLETLDGAAPPALPDALAHAPSDGRAVYRLAIRRPDDDAFVFYVLEASPLDGGPMRDDRCGAFTLSADGTKGNVRPDGANEWDPQCWGVR
ncbi:type IV pilin protein [Burkholderia stagnalis]|uniref:type IV pilin protein n=1 Tax=Burkholderia stagnalis TaxID=1503054 RepID=UPI000B1E9098|nr:prepilin-type N-terminal cleavage/methylation domain-containing protein [Burkholderia stagnalis]